MKILCTAWVGDEAHEYLLNLIAQGYYGEAWEFKMKLMLAFENSINVIMATTWNEELNKIKKQ